MQLSYRGLSYQPTPHILKIVESELQGLFLGQTYHLHCSVQSAPILRRSLGLRKYRGLVY